jgi:hypothetical protein
MSAQEPGLDLHEWETRWAEIDEQLAEDPVSALPLACDEIEDLLRLREGDEALRAQYPELEASYEAARELADRSEAGEEVDPGDVGAAIESLRTIRAAVLPAGAP